MYRGILEKYKKIVKWVGCLWFAALLQKLLAAVNRSGSNVRGNQASTRSQTSKAKRLGKNINANSYNKSTRVKTNS